MPSLLDHRILPTEAAFISQSGGPWRTNFGFLFTMSEPVDHDLLARSLERAVIAHPKMSSRARHGKWTGGPAPTPSQVEGLTEAADALVDEPFQPDRDAPIRVAHEGRHLLVACLHAATDANGLVGFCGTLLRTMAGTPGPLATSTARSRPVLAARAAWAPATFRELRRLRAPTAGRATPFPATSEPGGESESCIWSLTPEEARSLVERARRGGGVLGDVAEPVIRTCLARSGEGEVLVVLVPVNLRPPASRWFPIGNRIGLLLLRYDRPPSAREFKTDFDRIRVHGGYAAVWRRMGFQLKEALLGRSEGVVRLDSPPVSVAVNNLGRIHADELPGVEELAFLGSNTGLYPVVCVQTVGDRTTVCARVRSHQGGAAEARALVDAIRESLRAPDRDTRP